MISNTFKIEQACLKVIGKYMTRSSASTLLESYYLNQVIDHCGNRTQIIGTSWSTVAQQQGNAAALRNRPYPGITAGYKFYSF
jgi:hypothetical protein